MAQLPEGITELLHHEMLPVPLVCVWLLVYVNNVYLYALLQELLTCGIFPELSKRFKLELVYLKTIFHLRGVKYFVES